MTEPGAGVGTKTRDLGHARALFLVVMFGVISVFSNMEYQASRSLNGAFLGELGASAVVVGLVAGVSEFLGLSLRLLTGYLVDKTRAYWAFTLVGYGMLLVVPLTALTDSWLGAAVLVVLERISKAVRVPAKDTILSLAARRVGTGTGFGIHKSLDQVGGLCGPLLMSLVLSGALGTSLGGLRPYQAAYAVLWIPFILMAVSIFITYRAVPRPAVLEEELKLGPALVPGPLPGAFSRQFWIYCVFAVLSSMSVVSFSLIAFHAHTTHLLSDSAIPFFYALAMAAGGVAAFVSGRVYDRYGLVILYSVPVPLIFVPFLAFLGNSPALVVAAILVFGVVIGVQETIAKAAVADLTCIACRGLGYGVSATLTGTGVLLSGSAMGYLYTWSLPAVCVFVSAFAVAGILVLLFLKRNP